MSAVAPLRDEFPDDLESAIRRLKSERNAILLAPPLDRLSRGDICQIDSYRT